MNKTTLDAMPGEPKQYFSADSILENDENSFLYSTEFLNTIDLRDGYPPHYLVLKLEAPVILLRNLDPRRGLCNGTRMICKAFHSKVLETEIITGTKVGERVFLPRITFICIETQLPFTTMRRRHFPVRLAFAMSINKSQAQTLNMLGLYLLSLMFTHGQL